jgi:hypothetical protein
LAIEYTERLHEVEPRHLQGPLDCGMGIRNYEALR